MVASTWITPGCVQFLENRKRFHTAWVKTRSRHPNGNRTAALEVTNVGTDRSQLATMAQAAKVALRSDNLDVVADRGYFKGEEILACEQAGVAVTLPKPQTSGAKSAGRFGKPDFVYLAKDDVYRCPAG